MNRVVNQDALTKCPIRYLTNAFNHDQLSIFSFSSQELITSKKEASSTRCCMIIKQMHHSAFYSDSACVPMPLISKMGMVMTLLALSVASSLL